MAKGLRYQHRAGTELVTPGGTAKLDEDGYVTNLEELDRDELMKIPGFVETEVFGDERPKRPRSTSHDEGERKPTQESEAPSEDDYYQLIKQLTDKGGNLNSEGYLQMEVLTSELRERGWPIISGTRRIRITDEGREREKARPNKLESPDEAA